MSSQKPTAYPVARLLLDLRRQGVQTIQRTSGVALVCPRHVRTLELQSRVQVNALALADLLQGLHVTLHLGIPEDAWWRHLEQVAGTGTKPTAARAAVATVLAGKPMLPDTLDEPPAMIPETEPVAVDVETIGGVASDHRVPLPWVDPSELVCVGFSIANCRFAFPASDRANIQRFLGTSNPKVFHNAIYDLVWLLDAAFEIRGSVHDTLWSRAFENGAGVHGLKVTGTFTYAVHLPEKTPDLAKVLTYCANDARNTLSLFNPTSPWCSHPLYRLYQRMAPRVAAISRTGLPFFRDRVEARYAEAVARVAWLDAALGQIARINWRSADQVAHVLEEALPNRWTPGGQRVVDDAALRECEHPAAAVLLEKREVDKVVGTYLRPFLQRDRVCGLITLNAARTGRTSSRYTNLQNIPRSLRTLFGKAGHDWVKLDFAAAELVVAAVVAECSSLLAWFREGKDPHAETAARIFHKPSLSVTAEERAVGKTLNFSLCYGGTARTIVQRATSYGLAFSLPEAATFRTAWFAAFPEMTAWQAETMRQLEDGEPIRSPFGRMWTIPPHSSHERNMALNAPIQSTASDLLLLAADAIWDVLPGPVVNLVHDEVDVLIPKGTWDEAQWRDIARRMAGVDARFPMRVEVAVGPDWGATVEQFVEGVSV